MIGGWGGASDECATPLGVPCVRLASGFWVELVPLAVGCGGQASDQSGETGGEPRITACVVTLAWPKESLESRVLGCQGAPNGA